MPSGEELTLLDDFRFKARMPSRGAAVRELPKRGLAAEGFGTSEACAMPSNHGLGSNDGERVASLGKQLADPTENDFVDGKK